MSWVRGIKITDGLLTGEIFQRIDTDMNLESWNLVPDPQASALARVQGSGQKWQGIDILNLLKSQPDQTTQLYAGFDVDPGPNADYVRGQIRFMVEKSGYPGMLIFFRKYTDDTTYTDVRLTYTGISIAPVSLDRAKAIWLLFTLSNYSGESMILTGVCESYGEPTAYGLDGWAANYFEFVGNVIEGSPEETEESPEFGPASEEGGYIGGDQGTHDKSSDHSGIPTKPQYGFSSAGFLNHYIITAAGLEKLGPAVFPEPIGSSTSVEQALDRLAYNNWNSKLLDFLIDCRIIPVRPSAPTTRTVTAGGKGFLHPDTQQRYEAPFIEEDYVDLDCGTLHTDLTEGNFLDFSLARAQLFLPFYGFVEIAPEYWHGADLGVYYRFNMMDGSFMVWVTSKAFKSDMDSTDVIGQYAGNACIHLPINSLSYSNVISGMITTGAAIVGAAATGGIGAGALAAGAHKSGELIASEAAKANATTAGIGSASGAAFSGLGAAQNSRPQLIHNNSYNGSASMMSKRCPYLLIEFPNAQFSKKYTDEYGLPLVVEKVLGTMSGMTVCSNPILDDIPCTANEKERIRAALASGLIF